MLLWNRVRSLVFGISKKRIVVVPLSNERRGDAIDFGSWNRLWSVPLGRDVPRSGDDENSCSRRPVDQMLRHHGCSHFRKTMADTNAPTAKAGARPTWIAGVSPARNEAVRIFLRPNALKTRTIQNRPITP